MADVFADAAAYDAYMGAWSRLVATAFVDGLGLPAGQRWLDVGCGTGALSRATLDRAQPRSLIALDRSPVFVLAARTRLDDPRVEVRVGHADPLPLADGEVDVAVSGLVLNFLPDPPAAIREQVRVVAPGGTVAAFVWDYAEGMTSLRLFWQAAAAVDADQGADLDEGTRFPICRPGPLAEAWRDAGLADVAVGAVEVRRTFTGFAELWAPFLGGQGAAGGYLSSLDPALRAAIGEEFRRRVPVAADGSVDLTARAWTARGTVPR